MATLSVAAVKPLNRWNNNYIAPGGVASISAPQQGVHMRTSCSAMRHPKIELPNSEVGSNVVDGNNPAMTLIGAPARSIEQAFDNETKLKNGDWVQDLRPADRLTEPRIGPQFNRGWKEKVAKIYKASTTGSKFLPHPDAFGLPRNQLPRGGNTPAITTEGDINSSQNPFSQALRSYLRNPVDYRSGPSNVDLFRPPAAPQPRIM
jgi:hypothetical protein